MNARNIVILIVSQVCAVNLWASSPKASPSSSCVMSPSEKDLDALSKGHSEALKELDELKKSIAASMHAFANDPLLLKSYDGKVKKEEVPAENNLNKIERAIAALKKASQERVSDAGKIVAPNVKVSESDVLKKNARSSSWR